jgi:phosphonate transport system substrate-binding protein
MAHRHVMWLSGLVLVALAGCDPSPQEAARLTALKILVLPDRPNEQLEATYAPLVKYLARELDLRCELVIPESYERGLDLFHRGDVQLANLGGVAFVRVRAKDHAIPLVMRDVDLAFGSSFVASHKAPGKGIDSFRGKVLAFGPKLSTSGHFMPRHFLAQKNFVPEKFFAQVRYADTHDTTVTWVRDGVVDLGVVSSLALLRMYQTGLLRRDAVRIVWETPVYADYVWAVQADLPAHLRSQLREAFLGLSAHEPSHGAVLQALQAKVFMPAIDSDFTALERVAAESGLIE